MLQLTIIQPTVRVHKRLIFIPRRYLIKLNAISLAMLSV